MTTPRWLLGVLLAVVLVSGCSMFAQVQAPSTDLTQVHARAQAELDRWAAAVAASGGSQSFVPVGDLTGQIGDWEISVGENNKIALMAGAVVAGVPLPTETPPGALVRWDDGTTWMAPTISAQAALAALQGGHGAPTCPGCVSLQVTGARLSTARIDTSRGPATAPAWELTLAGTAVKVTRIAVAPAGVVAIDAGSLPPIDGWAGPLVELATGHASGLELTVTFTGSPGPGDKPCGADYSAEAIESATAIVVIVTEHRNPTPVACTAIGALRTASVALAAPLGGRAVLDISQGLPVSVKLAP